MKNNICWFYLDKLKMFGRRLSCFIFGHVRNCYLKPATIEDEKHYHKMIKTAGLSDRIFWRKIGKGWCAWCAQHTKEPVRLRK